MKFDPSDQEILEHLEAKALSDTRKLHPLIDEFIPTLDGENGICYTHPEKLPGNLISHSSSINKFLTNSAHLLIALIRLRIPH